MNKHIAEELAYKNGYEKGKEILSYTFFKNYFKGLIAALKETKTVNYILDTINDINDILDEEGEIKTDD